MFLCFFCTEPQEYFHAKSLEMDIGRTIRPAARARSMATGFQITPEDQAEIIADRAVDRALRPDKWREICGLMTRGFLQSIFHDSMVHAVSALNHKPQQRFPGTGENRNQRPDTPLIL
ncbi:MAG: hypothetical protein ACI9ZF_000803 [Bradyrhizobium sp.]